jgi:hypothetical protein
MAGMWSGLTEAEAERIQLTKFIPSVIMDGLFNNIPLDVGKMIMRCNPYSTFMVAERAQWVRKKKMWKANHNTEELELEAFLQSVDVCSSYINIINKRFEINGNYRVSEQCAEELMTFLETVNDLFTVFKGNYDDWVYVARCRS